MRGIVIEHGDSRGFDHQVAIDVDGKYVELCQVIRDAIRQHVGPAATFATIGGE
ncbi:hypothetical protein [Lacipirellula parvula]|uniref:hypothetical protein n=1 Tax=Lacipirellula parvula TaxID=2650471 RepID=UPI0015625BAF|nr:hypothetical protein [Lacipirellula parvula]